MSVLVRLVDKKDIIIYLVRMVDKKNSSSPGRRDRFHNPSTYSTVQYSQRYTTGIPFAFDSREGESSLWGNERGRSRSFPKGNTPKENLLGSFFFQGKATRTKGSVKEGYLRWTNRHKVVIDYLLTMEQ